MRANRTIPFLIVAVTVLVGFAVMLSSVLAGSPGRNQRQSAVTASSASMPDDMIHILDGGFWRTDGGFVSTIRIKNVLVVAPIQVTPTIFMADGTAYPLRPVMLATSGVASININDALAAAPQTVAPHVSQFGSAMLTYSYPSPGHVVASVAAIDVSRSLSFVYPVIEPMSMPDDKSQKILEGLWWKHDRGVRGSISLTNVTNQTRTVVLRVARRDKDSDSSDVELPAHTTQVLNLVDFSHDADDDDNRAGGVGVEYKGPQGAIIATGSLANESEGYSANMPFWSHDATHSPARKIDIGSAGIMVGKPNPMMMPGFPAGTSFIPYLTLRNSAAQPLDVTLRLNYMAGMEDGTPVNRNLTTQRLGPFEAKQVDVQRMLNAGGLKSFDGIVNLGMSYTGQIGDLILATGSVDQTGTYVFEVEPREVASSRSKFANYWSVANGSDTMFSLWNPTDAPQDIIATLYYGDGSGRYRFPVHLAAQASTMIDVAMLIMEKTRDLDGNVIPTHIHEGSAAFDNAKAQDRITVVIAAGTYNVLTATCSGGCISCCGTSNFAIDPSNFYCPIGESMPCSAHGSDCYGNTVYPTVFSWTSNNTAVMTVNSSGVVQGVSGGQATINADLGFLDVYTGTICGSGLGSCPTQHVGTGTGATVQVPTSLQVVANDTHVISESYANCSENVYGIAIAIHYQVLDQNGVAITSNQMEPQETVTNWVANNVNLGDRIPNWQDIGPTSYPGTSQYTDGSGRFWDAPFGFCFNVPTTTTETQSISILLSGTRYPTVASAARTNYWYSDTSSPGHGSITNNNDVSQSR